MDLTKSLPKVACVDTLKKCNEIEPFSKTVLEYGKNPATGKKYTQEEKDEKYKQFTNMCSFEHNELVNCCDPNNKLYSEFKGDKLPVKAKPIMKRGEIEGYEFCNPDRGNCTDEFKDLTPHDMCKVSNSINKIKSGIVKKINTVVPDCYSAVCSNQRYVPFIADPFTVEADNSEEYNMIQELKNDNLDHIKNYYNDNGLNTLTKTLKNGYPGNNILHEAIAHKSENIIDFILENKANLDNKNIDGNTPLHIAVLNGSEYPAYRMIKLGASIQKVNNLGDSVLHSAVRGGNLKIVAIVLHHNGSVLTKNNLGETPLHSAIMSPEKNIKIVKMLIDQGSDLLTKNNNGETLCGSLQHFKKTKSNEAIRTLVQQQIYLRHSDNYNAIVNKNPELSFIEAVNKETGEVDSIANYKLGKLDIELPKETISDLELYSPKKKTGLKTKIIEGFTASQLPDPLVINNELKRLIDENKESEGGVEIEVDSDLSQEGDITSPEAVESLSEDIEKVKCDTTCVFKYSTFVLFVLLALVMVLKFLM